MQPLTSPMGDVSELAVTQAIFNEADPKPPRQRPDIISLSFGGPVMEHPGLLRSAVAAANRAGVVLVASANNATCEPQYPAALPQVVAVGAVGPEGPAPFTNYGEWVDASRRGGPRQRVLQGLRRQVPDDEHRGPGRVRRVGGVERRIPSPPRRSSPPWHARAWRGTARRRRRSIGWSGPRTSCGCHGSGRW